MIYSGFHVTSEKECLQGTNIALIDANKYCKLKKTFFYNVERFLDFLNVLKSIFIDYFEKGRTINGEYYASLLAQLGKQTIAKLHKLKFELLPYPAYLPDLDPSDLFLFSYIKKAYRKEI